MKAENLAILSKNRILVPAFTVVQNTKDKAYTSFIREGKTYAVRSSCEVEDGDANSFAGAFLTRLSVPIEDIDKAIESVFLSMEKTGHKGSVIIQEMVHSEYSGVVFTSNPLGILNEMVLILGRGLGDGVVEDRTDVITYYFNKDEDILFHSGDKAIGKGMDIRKVFYIGDKIRTIFKKPMDIEFAINNNKVYILQARPITTLDTTKKPTILDNSNIAESFPDIALPLTQSFAKVIYRDIFRQTIKRLTGMKTLDRTFLEVTNNMVSSVNGRLYYQLNNWYVILNILPFSSKIIPIWQKMLGVEKNSGSDSSVKISPKIKCHVIFTFFSLLKNTPKHMDSLNKWFHKKYPIFIENIEKAVTAKELFIVYMEMEKEMMKRWDITLVNDMYSFIYTGLSNKSKLSEIKNLESMKPVLEMEELLRIYKKAGHNHSDYITAFEKYIDRYGDRCVEELKLETKTYRTNPELLTAFIVNNYKETDSFWEKNKSIHDTDTSIMRKRAKIGIRNREISRLNRSRMFGCARTIILKIEAILMSEGILKNKDDIFYLTLEELYDIIIRDKPLNTDRIIDERKTEIKMYREIPTYRRIIFSDTPFSTSLSNIKCDKGRAEDSLLGTGTSHGRIEGEAVVIKNISEATDVRDKIIVTKTTDPGWIFLLKACKGIICERGSLLSHTSIIARELKKPAIVNVKLATVKLRTGDRISMDTYSGRVRLMKGV